MSWKVPVKVTRLETRIKKFTHKCKYTWFQNYMRNGNKQWGRQHPWLTMERNVSNSTSVGTRKMVNYIYAEWRQWKFWWRLVVILTCKSFFINGYRVERLIETSSSWFSPKFPPGKLTSMELCRVKRMIRVFERNAISKLFSNFKYVWNLLLSSENCGTNGDV